MRITRLLLSILFLTLVVGPILQHTYSQNDGWRTMSDPKEEIDFEIPEAYLEIYPAKSPDELDRNRYYSRQGRSGFNVNTTNHIRNSVFQSYMEFSSPFDKECVKGDLAGFKTYECSFSESGYFHRFKVIATNHRIYSFYAYTNGAMLQHSHNFTASPRIVRKFKVKQTVNVSEIEKIWDKFLAGKNVNTERAKTTLAGGIGRGTGQGSGRGTGVGTGTGQGSGRGTGVGTGGGIGPGPPGKTPVGSGSSTGALPKPEKPADNTPLRILTKPRPGYTELARYFYIVGTVRVRVTFNADDQIGRVTPITRLPFGLTESAIRAARSMRFKAEKRRGKTVGVRKTVAYNFSIY